MAGIQPQQRGDTHKYISLLEKNLTTKHDDCTVRTKSKRKEERKRKKEGCTVKGSLQSPLSTIPQLSPGDPASRHALKARPCASSMFLATM
jgi:hypothetical protein